MIKTVFVLVSDSAYLHRAKKTIIDLRSAGQWHGDLVLINVGNAVLNQTFLDFYKIEEKRFPEIQEKRVLAGNILKNIEFKDTIDGREIRLINQWEKLHVMDPYFKKWERVVFLDAGTRVLYNVNDSILALDYKDKFLAPDDGGNYCTLPNPNKLFESQISHSDPQTMAVLKTDFPNIKDLKESYFLNCMWMYDTSILDICTKEEMVDGILKYPICKTNEMALMNLFLHFKYGLWTRFPKFASNGRILFDWCELNNPQPSTWRDYCFLKYPNSIMFEDT